MDSGAEEVRRFRCGSVVTYTRNPILACHSIQDSFIDPRMARINQVAIRSLAERLAAIAFLSGLVAFSGCCSTGSSCGVSSCQTGCTVPCKASCNTGCSCGNQHIHGSTARQVPLSNPSGSVELHEIPTPITERDVRGTPKVDSGYIAPYDAQSGAPPTGLENVAPPAPRFHPVPTGNVFQTDPLEPAPRRAGDDPIYFSPPSTTPIVPLDKQ